MDGLIWQPILMVTTPQVTWPIPPKTAYLLPQVERFYLARQADGQIVLSRWHVFLETQRDNPINHVLTDWREDEQHPFTFPRKFHPNTYYLPPQTRPIPDGAWLVAYDEEMFSSYWETAQYLNVVMRAISELGPHADNVKTLWQAISYVENPVIPQETMTPQMMIEILRAMQYNINQLPAEGRDEAHSASLGAERQAAFLALKNAIVSLEDYIEIAAQE